MAARLLEDPIPIRIFIVGSEEWIRASFTEEDIKAGLYQWVVIRRAEDLDPIYNYLNAKPRLFWDTETTGDQTREMDGLHPHSHTNRMVLFQVGHDDQEAFVVEPDLLQKYPHFKMLMENDQILHVAQNQLFDFKEMLAKYGIHVLNMWCTMLAEQVITAGKRGVKADLRSIVRRYKPCRTISKDVRSEFTTFNGILTRAIVYYAARDVVLLPSVYEQQAAAVETANLGQVVQVENDCIPVTAEMELTGLIIVPEILQQTLEYNQAEADRVSAEIHTLYNQALRNRGAANTGLYDSEVQWVTINLGSTKEKKDALWHIGLQVESTDSEVLEQLDHPIGPLICKWMNYDKVLSTYGERLLNMVHPDTGRFHPRFLQMGEGESSEIAKSSGGSSEKGTTATGRFSSNAQQFPKEKKVYAPVKDPQLIAQLREHFRLLKAA